jgi:NitT/TauT family transport system ATP-binding protein
MTSDDGPGGSRVAARGEAATVADPQPAIRLVDVGMTYADGGSVATHALGRVDLEVAEGEFVSVIGPSGCGKSTLLRIVGDLVQPTSGEVTVNGKSPRRARLDRDYGMVFQAPVLFDWRTVQANVELPLELLGYDRSRRAARALEMLELVDLTDFARHRPYQLSGGMQQRVAIARALAFEPSILLMDEPFGALDEMTRERMNAEVLRIWERTGTTMVFVTHSIPEAVFLSTRIVVMSPRPGSVTRIVEVDLPRPRDEATRESRRYFELVTAVREALRAPVSGDRAG